jgi:HEAT repeat protein
VLAAGDPAAIEEATRIVAGLIAASRTPEPDADKRRAAERARVLAALGARHATVFEDGIAGLADLKPLLPLSDEEQGRLAAAIARDDLPPRVRERLFAQVATLRIESLVPALQALRASDPAVTAAAWRALRQLGAAPDAKQIAELLRSPEPAVRSAAARELIARDPAAEVTRAARLAVDDPDPKVRVAVSEALGQSGSPAVIVVLERAFDRPPLEAQQAAARAIFQIGGRPAQQSFARLVFAATPEMQRYAITLLRATGIAENDPLLVKVRKEHPEEEVREVAEHGFPEPEH